MDKETKIDILCLTVAYLTNFAGLWIIYLSIKGL